jgi:FKBP-type peptidyl-prolyl cis-trans isomerase (trigger factor)
LALNAYTKSNDLGELAQKHRQAANDLWLIRERYLCLLVDLRMKEKPIEALQNQRDKLIEQLRSVYRGAPSTNLKAYTKAQEALQKLEDMTFSDAEIDTLLPKELKRTQTPGATRYLTGVDSSSRGNDKSTDRDGIGNGQRKNPI